ISQRSLEIRFWQGVGSHFEQKPCDRVVDCHEHTIACPRGFENKLRGESEWVQQPATGGDMQRKPGRDHSLFKRGNESRKRSRPGWAQSSKVGLEMHLAISIHPREFFWTQTACCVIHVRVRGPPSPAAGGSVCYGICRN